MVREAKTCKEISLREAVKKALKNCPAIMNSSVVSTEAIDGVDISGCYDEDGNEIEPDCIENCKSGNFSAKVRLYLSDGVCLLKDVSGTFAVTEHDAHNGSFKVELQINH